MGMHADWSMGKYIDTKFQDESMSSLHIQINEFSAYQLLDNRISKTPDWYFNPGLAPTQP